MKKKEESDGNDYTSDMSGWSSQILTNTLFTMAEKWCHLLLAITHKISKRSYRNLPEGCFENL